MAFSPTKPARISGRCTGLGRAPSGLRARASAFHAWFVSGPGPRSPSRAVSHSSSSARRSRLPRARWRPGSRAGARQGEAVAAAGWIHQGFRRVGCHRMDAASRARVGHDAQDRGIHPEQPRPSCAADHSGRSGRFDDATGQLVALADGAVPNRVRLRRFVSSSCLTRAAPRVITGLSVWPCPTGSTSRPCTIRGVKTGAVSPSGVPVHTGGVPALRGHCPDRRRRSPNCRG